MSVQKEPNGKFRVRWRVAGRQHSRHFTRRADAVVFDADIKRRRELGPALAADLSRESMTLDDFVRGPWRAHAATLSAPTRSKYAWALDRHLGELLDEPLAALDVARLAEHQRLMLDGGPRRDPATPSTIRDVLARLSGILQCAVESGHLSANAARALRKVPAEPREEVRPLSPVELERLIASLHGRDRAIVLLAGHLGQRPLEVRAAPWSAFDGSTLTVGRARTKATARRTRVITVPQVTARDLRAWRMESGRPADDQPIVGPMSAEAMKSWTRRVLHPAAKAATGGREDVTLYTLRHTHASACHYASFTLPEAARRLGHGAGLHVDTYAHVVDAISGTSYDDLDALYTAARSDLVCRDSAVGESGV